MENLSLQFSKRKIKKNYRSITGHFPSIKNNTSIGFEFNDKGYSNFYTISELFI